MCEIGQLVHDVDVGFCANIVAVAAYDEGVVVERLLELPHQRVDIVALIRQLPLDVELPGPIERRPGVGRQHGNARHEVRAVRQNDSAAVIDILQHMKGDDACNGFRCCRVERYRLAIAVGTSPDDCVEHVRQTKIGAVFL